MERLFPVGGNQLTGTLSTSISLDLQELWAYDNFLGGSLPESLFADEEDLRVLSLSDNSFDGTVPFIGRPEPLIGQTM